MNDETLNNLLQDWATRYALSPERAAAIRAAALSAPQAITTEALPFAWEIYFRRSLTATLQQANRRFSPLKSSVNSALHRLDHYRAAFDHFDLQ